MKLFGPNFAQPPKKFSSVVPKRFGLMNPFHHMSIMSIPPLCKIVQLILNNTGCYVVKHCIIRAQSVLCESSPLCCIWDFGITADMLAWHR